MGRRRWREVAVCAQGGRKPPALLSALPEELWLTHNFFAERWSLLPQPQRRLKNAIVVLEWLPASSNTLKEYYEDSSAPTDRERASLASAFAAFDRDGSGSLDASEALRPARGKGCVRVWVS